MKQPKLILILILADDFGFVSVVLPPISEETIGFNANREAEIIFPTIKKYLLEKNRNLLNISIYLDTLPDYKEFEIILNDLNI